MITTYCLADEVRITGDWHYQKRWICALTSKIDLKQINLKDEKETHTIEQKKEADDGIHDTDYHVLDRTDVSLSHREVAERHQTPRHTWNNDN